MISGETLLFLVMVACGAAASLLYDLFRAVRRVCGGGAVITVTLDILFCVLTFSAAAACVWRLGNGAFRFYEPLGILIGSALYFSLVSRWILKFFLWLIKNILKILLTPVHFLYKILRKHLIIRSEKDSRAKEKDYSC